MIKVHSTFITFEPVGVHFSKTPEKRQIIFRLQFNQNGMHTLPNGQQFLFRKYYETSIGSTIKLFFDNKERHLIEERVLDEVFIRKNLLKGQVWYAAVMDDFDFSPTSKFRLWLKWLSPLDGPLHTVILYKQSYSFLELAQTLAKDRLSIVLDTKERKILQNIYTIRELNQIVKGLKIKCQIDSNLDCGMLPKPLKATNLFGIKKKVSKKKIYVFLNDLVKYFEENDLDQTTSIVEAFKLYYDQK